MVYDSGEDNNADPLLPSPTKASLLYSFLSSSLANSTKFLGRGGEGEGEGGGVGREKSLMKADCSGHRVTFFVFRTKSAFNLLFSEYFGFELSHPGLRITKGH